MAVSSTSSLKDTKKDYVCICVENNDHLYRHTGLCGPWRTCGQSGCWWGDVVYNVLVVGDSGILLERYIGASLAIRHN
jgi:hypothetical protein